MDGNIEDFHEISDIIEDTFDMLFDIDLNMEMKELFGVAPIEIALLIIKDKEV